MDVLRRLCFKLFAMDQDLIILSKGIGPFRTRAFLAAAALALVWMVLKPALEVLVVALDDDLSKLATPKDFLGAELMLKAGLRGFLAWMGIFALMPLICGITVAWLSPKVEFFNTAYPILFLVMAAVVDASSVLSPTTLSWFGLVGSYSLASGSVLTGAYLIVRGRSKRRGASDSFLGRRQTPN